MGDLNTEVLNESTDQTQNIETPENQGTELVESTQSAPIGFKEFEYQGQKISEEKLKEFFDLETKHKQLQTEYEEQKFQTNLQADLERVKQNPKLMTEFMKVYPEKYHRYLETVLSDRDRQFYSMEDRLNKFESMFNESKQQKIEAELETTISALEKKYPEADVSLVINRALSKLPADKPGANLSAREWESIFKEENDRMLKRIDAAQQKRLASVKNGNARLRDAGKGGTAPARSPNMPRTIKEASALFRESIA